MCEYLESAGGNPGRSGHRLSIAAARCVYDAREAIAELLHAPDPLRVIFTLNVTHALNLAIRGLLRPGDHVVTSSIEHNSVMRPLRALERQGVAITVMRCASDGHLPCTRPAVPSRRARASWWSIMPATSWARSCRSRRSRRSPTRQGRWYLSTPRPDGRSPADRHASHGH